jgi:MFS family permease
MTTNVSKDSDYVIVGEVESGSEAADIAGAERAKPRSTIYWVGVLIILLLLSEEVAYAFNLVTPALPAMAAAFKTGDLAWISTLFTLSGAVTAPLIGKMADRQGKKKWLIISALCMLTGSLVVALAPTFAVVLIGRTLEGVGVAIVPITYSLIRDIFPKKMIAIAVSIATAGIGVTTILGPIFAGQLIDNFGFRGVFWALATFPAILCVLILAFVPESPIRVTSSLDWAGALTLGASLALLLYAIGHGATAGWSDISTILMLALAVVGLVAFILIEKRTREPLIDVSVLSSRGVVTTAIAQFSGQAIIVIQFILLSFIVQVPASLGITYGLGESADFLPRITTPAGIVTVAMGFLVGWLAERRGARLPNLLAFVFMGVGSLILAVSHSTFTPIFIGYVVYAFGGGLVSASIPNLVIAATPVQLQAVTANTIGVIGSVGSAVAVQVVFGVLGSHTLQVVQGQPIYGGQGFTASYYIAVGLAVVGLLATIAMRHGRRPESVEAHY